MPDPSQPIERISAVTLHTADMQASVDFYTVLGFSLRYGGRQAEFTSFAVGGGYLNLQAVAVMNPIGGSWGRTIFWVNDVDELFDRATGAGLRTASEPADAPWGERYFHILDPNGHEVSFARPLDPPR